MVQVETGLPSDHIERAPARSSPLAEKDNLLTEEHEVPRHIKGDSSRALFD